MLTLEEILTLAVRRLVKGQSIEEVAQWIQEQRRTLETDTPEPSVRQIDLDAADALARFDRSIHSVTTGENQIGQNAWAIATDVKEEFPTRPTARDIAAFRTEHDDELAKPGRNLGTRFDGESGMWEVGIIEAVANDDAAFRIGRERGERSLFHLADPEFEDVLVSDSRAIASKKMKLDNLHPERAELRARRFQDRATDSELTQFRRLPPDLQVRVLDNFSLQPSSRGQVSVAMKLLDPRRSTEPR